MTWFKVAAEEITQQGAEKPLCMIILCAALKIARTAVENKSVVACFVGARLAAPNMGGHGKPRPYGALSRFAGVVMWHDRLRLPVDFGVRAADVIGREVLW